MENFWNYSANEKKVELNNIHNTFGTPLFESTIMVSNIDEIKEDLYKKYSAVDESGEILISDGSVLSTKNLSDDEKNVTVRDRISYYSESDLHKQDIYKELTSEIINITKKVFDAYEYVNITPTISSMWGNVLGTGGYIHAHSHSNSMFSGVWYPDDPPETEKGSLSNYIKFIEPNRIKFFYMPQIRQKNMYNSGEIFIKPRKGMCLIFPSWFEHDTVRNENMFDKRYSISFNIFPQGTLGYPNSLNYLEI